MLPGLAFSSGAASAPSELGTGGFGPDFLLGAVTSGRIGAAAGYDALGRALTPAENSPEAKARAANLNVAKISIQTGDYSAARLAAQRILDRDPSDTTANYYIARIDMHERSEERRGGKER